MCGPFDCLISSTLFVCAFGCILAQNAIQLPPIIILPNWKLFFAPQPSTSKFPPFIEFFVQRIQTQFSNYVYEDLSRPQTYDKPVYTLSPAEEATVTDPLSTSTTSLSVSTESTNFIETDGDLPNASQIVNNDYGTLVVYLKNSTAKNSDLNSTVETSKIAGENQSPDKIDLGSTSLENVTSLQKMQNYTSPVLLGAVLNITIKVPVLVTNQTLLEHVP